MEKVFGITPASSAPYIFILVFSVVLLALIGLFIYIGYSARYLSFQLNDDGLRIGPGLYGRFIPREQIDAGGVRVVDLNVETNLKPKRRTNGVGMPGYAAGWFKLQNDEKALMFVTDRSRVVYLPTRQGYSLLMSTPEAEEFAELIRHWD
jgi:hypothetical protein